MTEGTEAHKEGMGHNQTQRACNARAESSLERAADRVLWYMANYSTTSSK